MLCDSTKKTAADSGANQEETTKSIVRLRNTKLEDELSRKGGVMLRFWVMSRGHVY